MELINMSSSTAPPWGDSFLSHNSMLDSPGRDKDSISDDEDSKGDYSDCSGGCDSMITTTSSTPKLGNLSNNHNHGNSAINPLVDEEFLNHYKVREITENLTYNYAAANAAAAAVSYYDYYGMPGKLSARL